MTASTGMTGQGTTIAGGTTTSLGDVYSIVWTGADVGILDITTNASLTNWKEKCSDIKDAGSIEVKAWYAKAISTTDILRLGQTAETWTVTYQYGGKLSVSGILRHFGIDQTQGSAVGNSFTIELTGVPGFTTS